MLYVIMLNVPAPYNLPSPTTLKLFLSGQQWLHSGEHLTHDPNFEGSNLGTIDTGREKRANREW